MSTEGALRRRLPAGLVDAGFASLATFAVGLAAVGVRKHYYRDDDAVIMWATDIDQPEYAARLDEIRSGLEVAP